jgi:hypothetical protein
MENKGPDKGTSYFFDREGCQVPFWVQPLLQKPGVLTADASFFPPPLSAIRSPRQA